MENMKTIISTRSIVAILFAMAFAATSVVAQDGTKTRSITSDDFASQRPARAKTAGRKSAAKPKRYSYKFVRADRNVGRKPTKPKTTTANSPIKITEIGVTMWRLRAPRAGEQGQLFPVVDANKDRKMWLAERVRLDTVFTAGEKVRFAIESSDVGYLYIFDREMHADGSMGAPYMIFPESSLDDNSVAPGIVVDIPDGRDDVPYFNINPKDPNYTGEMITVIVSPKPLTDLEIDETGKLARSDVLTDLEFGTESEVFSRSDSSDKLLSKAEADAMCGPKARHEEPKVPGKPCGVKTRQLTRDEPFPQSIYRVRSVSGQPAVAFVKLAAK
jgi:Domain of unknown function (DUF4384)